MKIIAYSQTQDIKQNRSNLWLAKRMKVNWKNIFVKQTYERTNIWSITECRYGYTVLLWIPALPFVCFHWLPVSSNYKKRWYSISSCALYLICSVWTVWTFWQILFIMYSVSFLLLNLTFCFTTAVKCFRQILKCLVEQLSRHFIKFPYYMLSWITYAVRFVSRFCRCSVSLLSLLPLMAVGSQCSRADSL